MKIKALITQLARNRGYDIVRYSLQSAESTRFIKLLNDYHVDLVFDVGANTGQYAHSLRTLGYTGRIVSFEPLRSAFMDLQRKAQGDNNWICEHKGLGPAAGRGILNVAGNSQSSSVLEMLPRHYQSSPKSQYVGEEEIELSTVDIMFEKHFLPGTKFFLKMDTQGYERFVLEGAKNALQHACGLEMEMSLVPLYKDELLWVDMIQHANDLGFSLTSVEPVYFDPNTGQLLQVNGIFFRIGAKDDGGK